MDHVTIPHDERLFAEFLGRDPAWLEELSTSGVLRDLGRCTNPAGIDRVQCQKALGLEPTVFRLKMGGHEDTDQIMEKFHFPSSKRITQANFPLLRGRPWQDEIEIIPGHNNYGEKEGLKFLEAAGIERPEYEHGLRFAAQYGNLTSKSGPYVVFLHEAWERNGYQYVLCLHRGVGGSKLILLNLDTVFNEHHVLAGVRRRHVAS